MAAYTRYRIWFKENDEIQSKIVYGPDIKDKHDAVSFLKLHHPDAEIGHVGLARL